MDLDHEIYTEILKGQIARNPGLVPLIQRRTWCTDGFGVWRRTDRREPVWRCISSMPGLLATTIEDYVAKNREPVDLGPPSLSFPYELLSEAESSEIFGGPDGLEAGYRTIRERFPRSDGLIQFSRVGFDEAGRQALVCFGQMWGPLFGRGYYFFLEVQEGGWSVRGEEMAWIS